MTGFPASFWITILLGAAAIPCLADDTPSTQPDDPAKRLSAMKDQDRESVLAAWQGMPSIPARTLHDTIRLRLDNGLIVCDSPLYNGTAIRNMIPLTDHPGVAMMRVKLNHRAEVNYALFEYYDFSDPVNVEFHLQILSAPTSLQLAQDVEYPDHTESTTFLERADAIPEERVSLRFQSDRSGEPAVYVTDSSIPDLRRDHPTEVEQYLRPLIHHFGQDDSILGVDPRTAWQVFSDTWKPPAGLSDQVQSLVNDLNAEDYSVRRGALKKLREIGQPAALCLITVPRDHLTPEQQARIDEFLAIYRPLTDGQAAMFRKDINFLLDCMDTNDATLRASALNHLQKAVGRSIAFNLDQSPLDRAAAVLRLRQQLAPATQPSTGPSSG